jgi:hypothetical protein
VLVASSEGHSDNFVAVFEELLTHVSTTVPGTSPQQLVRADIIFYELPVVTGEGEQLGRRRCVFSVGSITFCGSLPLNDGKPHLNNVAALLYNVLSYVGAV